MPEYPKPPRGSLSGGSNHSGRKPRSQRNPGDSLSGDSNHSGRKPRSHRSPRTGKKNPNRASSPKSDGSGSVNIPRNSTRNPQSRSSQPREKFNPAAKEKESFRQGNNQRTRQSQRTNLSGSSYNDPYDSEEAGRKPVSSAENDIYEDEQRSVDSVEGEERRKKKKRCLGAICCCLCLLFILLLALGLGGVMAPNEEYRYPDHCKNVNTTVEPTNYIEYQCNVIKALDKDETTYLAKLSPSSNEGKAIGWMTTEDANSYDILSTPPDQILERYAMALLYYATDGPGWYHKYDFLNSDKHVCDWHEDDISCNGALQLTAVELHQNGLEGKLPPEIGFLSMLTRLRLPQNNLFGKIPTEIGKLTAMEKLYLSTNNFDGKIPTEIDQLTKLKTLNLEGNKLTGDLDQLCSDTETGRITKHDVFVSDCNRNKLKCSCCDCFD